MKDSWIGIPPDRQTEYGERIGWMYLTRMSPEPHDPSNSRPEIAHVRQSGNGRGPIQELGCLYEMLLAGGEGLLAGRTIAALTSRKRVGLFDHTFQHEMDWGLGFMVDNNRYGPDTVPYSFGRLRGPGTRPRRRPRLQRHARRTPPQHPRPRPPHSHIRGPGAQLSRSTGRALSPVDERGRQPSGRRPAFFVTLCLGGSALDG